MKKVIYIAVALFIGSPIFMSCREEGKEVEAQELRDDVSNDNSNDSTYDTNPTENDPD